MKRTPYSAYNPNVNKTTDAKIPSVSEINNRGNDNKLPDDVKEITSVKLELVDETIIKFLSDNINPIITQDGNAVKVPVVYGNPERWKSIQKDSVTDYNDS
jgi:hypothetical protein